MSETEFSCADLDKVLKEHPKLMIVFTQKGCTACDTWKESVKEIEDDLKDVEIAEIELGISESPCENLADKYEVNITPTTLYFKDGELKGKMMPKGDKEELKHQIKDLVALQ